MSRDELREQMKELAAGYVLGNLSPDEAETLQQYTGENPEFANEIDCLCDILGVLPYGLPPQTPPVDLRDRLLAALPPRENIQEKLDAATTSDRAGPNYAVAPTPTTPRNKNSRDKNFFSRWQRWLRFAWSSPWLTAATTGLALASSLVAIDARRTSMEIRAELNTALERAESLEIALQNATGQGLPVLEPDATLASTWQLDRLIDDHRRAFNGQHSGTAIATAELLDIVREFEDVFEFAPTLPVLDAPGIVLVGGTFCRLGKTAGVRFTYRTADGRNVSLYQIGTPDNRLALPEARTGRFHIRQAGEPEILLWSHDGFDYALVAEMPRDRLVDLSDVRYEIISQ